MRQPINAIAGYLFQSVSAEFLSTAEHLRHSDVKLDTINQEINEHSWLSPGIAAEDLLFSVTPNRPRSPCTGLSGNCTRLAAVRGSSYRSTAACDVTPTTHQTSTGRSVSTAHHVARGC